MDNQPSIKRIAILTFSDIKNDPRISRVAELFVSQGHQVRVYTISRESTSRTEDYGSIKINSISIAGTETYHLDTKLFFSKIGSSLQETFLTLWPEIFIDDIIRIQPGDKRELLLHLYRQTLSHHLRRKIHRLFDVFVKIKLHIKNIPVRVYRLLKSVHALPATIYNAAFRLIYAINFTLSKFPAFRRVKHNLKKVLTNTQQDDTSFRSTSSDSRTTINDQASLDSSLREVNSTQSTEENVTNEINHSTLISPIDTLNRDIASTKQILQINLLLDDAVDNWPTHIYSNDLETLFAGVMAKRRLNAKLIYDAHEIWPQQWTINYRSGAFVGFFSNAERALLSYTDLRLTIGNGLGKYFEYCYASKPFVIIPNTPRLIDYAPDKSLKRHPEDVRLIYHGIYAPERGFEQIIELAEELEKCKIYFRGVGAHGNYLKELVDKRGLNSRIEFLPPVAADELAKSAINFDIGLIPAVNSCINTNFGFPNKLFEYMSAGLAIATTNLIDLRDLVTTNKLGVVFDINDKKETVLQINSLITDRQRLEECKRNSRHIAETEYNWLHTSRKLLTVLPTVEL
jgi:glycosyltransferase involved in cell wall biosynthesis